MATIEERPMSKIHQDKEYQALSSSIHSKYFQWANSRVSKKVFAEVEDLKTLSFQVYKLAKFLEESTSPKTKNLDLFGCANNQHDIKAWTVVAIRVDDRREILRGSCTKCPAEITNYG